MDKPKSPVWQAKYIGDHRAKYTVCKNCKHYKNCRCENVNECEEGDGFEDKNTTV